MLTHIIIENFQTSKLASKQKHFIRFFFLVVVIFLVNVPKYFLFSNVFGTDISQLFCWCFHFFKSILKSLLFTFLCFNLLFYSFIKNKILNLNVHKKAQFVYASYNVIYQ